MVLDSRLAAVPGSRRSGLQKNMSATEWVLNSWWLLPALWVGLSLLTSAALSTAPDAVSETIGRYMDAPIPGSARFEGVEYEFDRICPPQSLRRAVGERVITPGIVYARRFAVRAA
jgi:hypothetical protein